MLNTTVKPKLIQFLLWCLSKLITGVFISDNREYTTRVIELMARENKIDSGEYKRHRVLSRLIKEFPNAKKSDLALEIELCFNSHPDLFD